MSHTGQNDDSQDEPQGSHSENPGENQGEGHCDGHHEGHGDDLGRYRRFYQEAGEDGKMELARQMVSHLAQMAKVDVSTVYDFFVGRYEGVALEVREVMASDFSILAFQFAAPVEELRHLITSAAEEESGRFVYQARGGMYRDQETGELVTASGRTFEMLLLLKEKAQALREHELWRTGERLPLDIFAVPASLNELT